MVVVVVVVVMISKTQIFIQKLILLNGTC